ncbi:MAG: zinc ribbon domain-containing protein [Bacillus sp. (in: firmicutes)]
MAFCKQCGNQVKPGAQFCNQCGAKIDSIQQQSVEQDPGKSKTGTRPMTKKKKWLWIIGALAAILLFSAYKGAEYALSKERLINKFEQALIHNDSKATAKLLTSMDKKLEINEDAVKGFLAYYEENPDEITNTIQILKEQSAYLDKAESSKYFGEFTDIETSKMVNLTKGKKILFFNQYQLNVESAYVTISTNFKGTEISIDGEKVGESTEADYKKMYGPYMPGLYEVQAKLKTDFGDLTHQETIEMSGGDKRTINMDLDGKSFDFSSTKNKKLRQKLMDATVNFNRERLEAYTSADVTKLTTATKNVQSDLQESIDNAKEYGTFLKEKYEGVIFDLDSFNLYASEGNWYAEMDMLVEKKTDTFYAGQTPVLEAEQEALEVTLLYDESSKGWLVDRVSGIYYFDEENTQEVKEKNPKEYTVSWYKGSSSSASTAEEVVYEDEAETLMEGYIPGFIKAVNNNDFSQISPYLKEGSELYNSQKKLIDKLYNNGTTEELLDYKVTSSSTDGNVVSIYTYEKIKINYADGKSETKEYEWRYEAEVIGSELLLTSIHTP